MLKLVVEARKVCCTRTEAGRTGLPKKESDGGEARRKTEFRHASRMDKRLNERRNDWSPWCHYEFGRLHVTVHKKPAKKKTTRGFPSGSVWNPSVSKFKSIKTLIFPLPPPSVKLPAKRVVDPVDVIMSTWSDSKKIQVPVRHATNLFFSSSAVTTLG